ncbi:hypothetical protein [Dermatobacter hominis]|uniref:hypothetical protein n=1 Tax=Dermatobacter hominis TaxID=2884263 RepID=UPI001D1255D2|nr:hypothetical protein [Dermatobacter hominis]UDY37817.1 hypothetical protein LH044_09805 [Dermatobacter hominis]
MDDQPAPASDDLPPRRSPWDPPPGAAPPPSPPSVPPPAPRPPAGGAEPPRGVRGQRYGGPRLGGRGALALFGLLGVLVTVGIMAFLAVQVLDGVGGSDDADVGASLGDPAGGPASTVALDPTAPSDGAAAAACATTKDTLETAAEAYRSVNGSYPPDLAALVSSGMVDTDGRIDFELRVEGDTLVVTGTGSCAGS